MIDIKNWIEVAKKAAIDGGDAILEIYHSADFGIEHKKDDSPLTKADKAANDVIVEALLKTGLPILSEEGKDIDFEERKHWEYFWLVDPLDGTKEFIKRNGEFTVNIALIHQGKAIAGVLHCPVLNTLYWGISGEGAWKEKAGEVMALSIKNEKVKSIVASRSHLSPETQSFIDHFEGVSMESMGSSLKFMLVAEGQAQLYPRFAPTMEWDTAAAQAIVESAGGVVYEYPSLQPLLYNRENLLNPWFIVGHAEVINKIQGL